MANLVRFGGFELDLGSGELKTGGVRTRLQEQPFRVLACLIERPGEVVTRQELQRRLWNDGRFVDFEHGINAAIKRLRVALDDDAEHPRFVETVQRRGYRFLAPISHGDAERRGTESASAHDAYVKGLYHWTKPGASGLGEAVAFFEAAIAADPAYAAAHSALARALVALADYYVREPRLALHAAGAAAERALALDPHDANGHVALGDVKRSLEWDWDGAERAYRDALAADPRNEAALRGFGVLLAARGDKKDAVAAAERACALDPLCLAMNTGAAFVHYLCGDYERAVARCRHTLDMDAAFAPAQYLLSATLVQLNRHAEAMRVLAERNADNADPVDLAWYAYAAASAGEQTIADAVLERLATLRARRFVPSFHVARVQAALGRRDAAVASLLAAVNERDPALFTLPLDPGFSGVRSEPRVVRLIRELRLRRGGPIAATG